MKPRSYVAENMDPGRLRMESEKESTRFSCDQYQRYAEWLMRMLLLSVPP